MLFFWTTLKFNVSKWIFKVTSHYSIFNQLPLFVASHNILSKTSFVKLIFDKFLRFFISLLFFLFGAAELQRSKTSYNIASKNCLSSWFSNFLRFFYQLVLLCGFQLTGCKTLPNISSFLLLSNQFLTFFRFFISPLRIAAFQLTKCKTSPNISSDFDLSNHFHVFCVFFYIFRKNIAFSTQNKQKSSSPPPNPFQEKRHIY